MPSRKSDASAPASASASASARFAPIEDDPPAIAPMQQPHQTSAPGPAPALGLPTMDPSMPPPSLPPPSLPPPPGTSHTPDAVAFHPRPGSAATSVLPPGGGGGGGGGGGAPAHSTPSDKGKEREEGGKSGPGGHPKEAITIPIEELQLPKSIITRLAKGVLPPNTQIQANAILAMTKSATVFINHLASAANEVTALQTKKTIMPADVFRALDDIEYGFMRERVEAEFAKFNETQTTKRSAYRKKVAATKKGAPKGSGEGGDATDGDTTMGGADGNTTMNSAADSSPSGGGGQHRSKKARTDGQMDAEEEMEDASDPEDVPLEEEEDEPQDEDEEEDEEDEEHDGGGENDEEQDELEEREGRPDDDDEALDDGNNSD